MALSMTSVRAPVAFRSAALAPRTVVRSSPVVHQRRSLVVRAEVGHCAHHFLLFNDCGLVLLSGATTHGAICVSSSTCRDTDRTSNIVNVREMSIEVDVV